MGAARSLEEDIYSEICDDLKNLTGNQFGDAERNMVVSRLSRRISELGLSDIKEYQNYRKAHLEEENQALVSLLTTHYTYFFREPKHYDFITTALPSISRKIKSQGRRKLKVWCAACSYGQEVYSFAIHIGMEISRMGLDIDYEILGSDIDREAVSVARNGVYKWDEVKKVPTHYLENGFVRGKGDISNFAKIKKEFLSKCTFEQMNLLKLPKSFDEKFDLIICRNVFIYLELSDIQKAVRKFSEIIHPYGFMITGVSENLEGQIKEFNNIGSSVYRPVLGENEGGKVLAFERKPEDRSRAAKEVEEKDETVKGEGASNPLPSVLRVLCVDDSPTVLSILKKMLVKENGFEIVATATNGVEAKEVLAKTEVDVMTLDIHMPEMNGVEYLRNHFSGDHIPVVMVSTVSRENADLAVRSLELGASDYVEKPTLKNVSKISDELCAKLKFSYLARSEKRLGAHQLTKSFASTPLISNTGSKVSVFSLSVGSRDRFISIAKARALPQPAWIVLLDAAEEVFESMAESFSQQISKARVWTEGDFHSNNVYFIHLSRLKEISEFFEDKTSVFVQLADESMGKVSSEEFDFLIVEESQIDTSVYRRLSDKSNMTVPATSISYEIDKFLSGSDK